ncbi:MAG: ABC transporter permease [Methanomicrobiales archaeon]|nr:ABC transporter permease [Methanomicrobiales archaeon]
MIRGAIAIFRRDFKKFAGNPFVLVFTLFMPVIYLIIFGNAMGGTISHIPIGVAQEDGSFAETPLFVSATADLLHYQPETEKPRTFDVTVFSSESSAKAALNAGNVMAVVIFPSSVSNDQAVRLYVDSSEYLVPSLIESGVRAVLAARAAPNPVYVNRMYGDIEYIQFFGVGVIVLAIFMTTMLGGGIALIRDRENGIIEGYLVTPVQRASIILGIIASGTIKAFLAGCIIFLVDIYIAGIIVDSIGTFLLILLVIFITSIGITSVVVSFASRFSAQQEYASSLAFLNLVLFMTSGAFYTVLGMPFWLRWITVINPEYYAVHALRSLILKGEGHLIGMDLVALSIFSCIAIAAGIISFRRTLE